MPPRTSCFLRPPMRLQVVSVTIAAFGAFSTRSRQPRIGRNPRTGESIAIAPGSRLHSNPRRHFATRSADSRVKSIPTPPSDPPTPLRHGRPASSRGLGAPGCWSQKGDGGISAISPFMRARAQPRVEFESPRARVPYTARCEFSPTTTLRPGAQTKYQARYPAAYCGHRSPTKHPVPPTTTQRDRPASIDLTIVNRTIPFQISPSSLP